MKPLTLYQLRVIGSLIEKSLTTPDQYPLSLNALTNSCNQKSNREPVLELAESTVQTTVAELVELGLVTEVSGFGSRVVKLQHRFCNTEFSEYRFSAQELGILCVMFLRGPQTPGELRSRTNRLCEFKDVQEVEIILHRMLTRATGPLIQRINQPGKRESRYQHLFGTDDLDTNEVSVSTRTEGVSPSLSARLADLEEQVQTMRAEIDSLKQILDDLTS
jgi:uncharacterized protein